MPSTMQPTARKVQTFLAIVAFFALVMGISFARNWVRTPPPSEAAGTGDAKEVRLSFVNTTLGDLGTDIPEGVPEQGQRDLPEREVAAPGSADFWYENPFDFDVEVGLEHKSCRCNRVDVLALSPEAIARGRAALTAAGAARVAAAAAGVAAWLGPAAAVQREADAFLGPDAGWQPLEVANADGGRPDKQVALVPARAAGIIRLNWTGKPFGREAFTAQLWTQARGREQTRCNPAENLRAEASFVFPVMVQHTEVTLPVELRPGSVVTASTLVWSSTRAAFNLSARESNGDPCFVCTCEPLTGPAHEAAAKEIEKTFKQRARVTYRLTVTVHERLPGGQQLELGPLQRRLVCYTGLDDFRAIPLPIKGIVRGDIRVGTPADRDRIVFGNFRLSDQQDKIVPIDLNQAGVGLEFVSKKPDFLKVKLDPPNTKSQGRPVWTLTVTIPAHATAGELPPESEVVLKTTGAMSRRIRIPVVGRAIVR